MFNISLAILKLEKNQLIQLEFGDINEFFKALKDDGHLEQSLLPPVEEIIEEAQRIYIPDEKFNHLFKKHQPKIIETKRVPPIKKVEKRSSNK